MPRQRQANVKFTLADGTIGERIMSIQRINGYIYSIIRDRKIRVVVTTDDGDHIEIIPEDLLNG